jgi:hypothetical protein
MNFTVQNWICMITHKPFIKCRRVHSWCRLSFMWLIIAGNETAQVLDWNDEVSTLTELGLPLVYPGGITTPPRDGVSVLSGIHPLPHG